jgi:hypothetical protein
VAFQNPLVKLYIIKVAASISTTTIVIITIISERSFVFGSLASHCRRRSHHYGGVYTESNQHQRHQFRPHIDPILQRQHRLSSSKASLAHLKQAKFGELR